MKFSLRSMRSHELTTYVTNELIQYNSQNLFLFLKLKREKNTLCRHFFVSLVTIQLEKSLLFSCLVPTKIFFWGPSRQIELNFGFTDWHTRLKLSWSKRFYTNTFFRLPKYFNFLMLDKANNKFSNEVKNALLMNLFCL